MKAMCVLCSATELDDTTECHADVDVFLFLRENSLLSFTIDIARRGSRTIVQEIRVYLDVD
jgi:hypothetical protein